MTQEERGRFAAWGERIKEARGDRSQTWLARVVGVNQTTVSGWERGDIGINDEQKLKIADAFGVYVGDLFPWSVIVRRPIKTIELPDRSPVQVEARQ